MLWWWWGSGFYLQVLILSAKYFFLRGGGMRGDLWLSSDHQLSKVPHPPQKVYPPKCIRISKQDFFFRLQGWRRFRFYLSTDKYINSIPPEYENQKKCRLQRLKIFFKIHFYPDGKHCVCKALYSFFFVLQGWARATLSLFIIVLCSAVSVLLCVCVCKL